MFSYYRLYPDVQEPRYATVEAACFDLFAYLPSYSTIRCFSPQNQEYKYEVQDGLVMHPGTRALVPTGLILDIDCGYSVRLHPRSGLTLKYGLILANCEGVIDSDYTEPVFVLLTNISQVEVWVHHNDRVAQGELVRNQLVVMKEVKKVKPRGNRIGGFGSTGR